MSKPRNVRNFWIEVEIPGRTSTLAGGPVGKDAGMYATLYVRDHGEVTRALTIQGVADEDGTLRLFVEDVLTHQALELSSTR